MPRLTVDHDCGSLGWGNWISALPNTASLALTLGARLNVHHEGARARESVREWVCELVHVMMRGVVVLRTW
jgi:hypothetical protein